MQKAEYDAEIKALAKQAVERKLSKPKVIGAVVSRVDNSFMDAIRNSPTATEAYKSSDVKVIMKKLDSWYSTKLGSLGALTDLDEAKSAEADWKQFHQSKNDSCMRFFNLFDSIVPMYEKAINRRLTQPELAFELITKLNLTLYGEWVAKMRLEEKEYLLAKKRIPTLARKPSEGYPQSLAEAKDRILLRESHIALESSKKPRPNPNPKPKEVANNESETDNSEPAMSFAACKPSNPKSDGTKLTGEQIRKFTARDKKPSHYGMRGCKRKACRGNDDHWHHLCPNQPDPNNATEAPNKQISLASVAGNIDLEKLSDLLIPRLLEAQSKMKMSRMDFLISKLSFAKFNSNPYIIGLDTLGTRSDMRCDVWKFNKRSNPDNDLTEGSQGPYLVSEICDHPFIGVCNANSKTSINVWGAVSLSTRPGFTVDCRSDMRHCKVHIEPLDVTVEFDTSRYQDVLTADGTMYHERLMEYVELCRKLRLDPIQTSIEGTNIRKLRELASQSTSKLNKLFQILDNKSENFESSDDESIGLNQKALKKVMEENCLRLANTEYPSLSKSQRKKLNKENRLVKQNT